MDITIVLTLLIFGAAICYALAPFIKERMKGQAKKSADLNITMEEKEKIVSEALASLNCEVTWSTDEEWRRAAYDYQNGHFRIRFTEKNPYLELGYFFFFVTDMENLQLVRHLCNSCNMSTDTALIFYTLEEERNKICLHMLAKLLPDKEREKAILTRAMNDMYKWQAAFIRGFDNKIDTSKKAELRDMEADRSQWLRQLFLLREQEMQHQDVSAKERLGTGVPLTVGELFDTMFVYSGIKAERLKIATDEVSEITEEDAIMNYNIADAIISEGSFMHQEATLTLCFTDLSHPDEKRNLLIHLLEEKGTENTLYFRVTTTLLPMNISRDIQPTSFDNQALSRSMLVAYDMRDTEQLRSEYLYMKKEAEALHHNGEDDKMSDEQRLLIECTDEDLGYHLYHGKRLFLAKRFLEAVPHLQDAFDMLMPSFQNLKQKLQEVFYDTCYMLGFCYNEMKQFQRAYYYLEIIFPLRRITYTEEYINCLVNQHDFRVLNVIDAVQEMVENALNNEDKENDDSDETEQENDTAIESFNGFLKRRKAYVLIDTGRYDEARSILNELLSDPASSDFAMSELAYLQKIENQTS